MVCILKQTTDSSLRVGLFIWKYWEVFWGWEMRLLPTLTSHWASLAISWRFAYGPCATLMMCIKDDIAQAHKPLCLGKETGHPWAGPVSPPLWVWLRIPHCPGAPSPDRKAGRGGDLGLFKPSVGFKTALGLLQDTSASARTLRCYCSAGDLSLGALPPLVPWLKWQRLVHSYSSKGEKSLKTYTTSKYNGWLLFRPGAPLTQMNSPFVISPMLGPQ